MQRRLIALAICCLSTPVLAQPAPAAPAEPPSSAPGQTPPAAEQPPPGSSHATFISTTAVGWDVTLDDQLVCATPCSVWVPPLHFVALHSHEADPVRLDVGYMPAGDVLVRAKPLSSGAYAAGITFVTLSSMGLVTGVTLTAVGCATNNDGMCKGGIITGVAGALGLYGSILLMRHALPKAHIGPATPYVSGTQVGLAGQF
jgi:hypothetical protein